MKQTQQMPYDDEIDLFELFEILWSGKWIISAFVVVVLLMGFGYTKVVKPKYKVSVRYELNLYSVRDQQFCAGDASVLECFDSTGEKRLKAFLGAGWSKEKKRSEFSFITQEPSNVDYYLDEFQKHNQAITNEMLNEANTELLLIQTEIDDALISTERVATNTLNAKRIINSINNGELAISFSTPSITKSSPKVTLILVLSFVLGGMLGVAFILVRDAILKYKKRMTDS